MAFYSFQGNNSAGYPLGAILRRGLDGFRSSVADLQHVKGVLNQMDDAQVAVQFGIQAELASAAKSELLSDIPELSAAEQQMLDQFG